MNTLFLILHIIAGFAALLAGSMAIFTRKGKGVHVWAGRVFFWSMVLVAVTALWLSVVRPNLFLLLIAIFSFYLTWSGYRAIRWKNNFIPGWAGLFDQILVPTMVLTGLIMMAIPLLSRSTASAMPDFLQQQTILLLVFGFITTAVAGRDLMLLLNPRKREKFGWIYRHIASMGGAYIATLTAFLVVNITFLPGLLVWMAPTVIGSPLIAWSIRKYRVKFEGGKAR